MCILFIYTNPCPEKNGYRLIIASNRDEYYRRPAKSAYLCTESNIIGGRDMESGREGGMWLGASIKGEGIDKRICIGTLLNLTGEERKSGVEGRGFIVADYLKSKQSLDEYLESLQEIQHNAFNFVSVELSYDDVETVHYTNIGQTKYVYKGKQCLGFGNSPVKSPLTKVQNGTKNFTQIIGKNLKREELTAELLFLLKRNDKHLPDEELQKRAPTAYELLSSIFVSIKGVGYGSRTHSIILVDYDWKIDFIEHTMKEPIDPDNVVWDTNVIQSSL